MAAPFFTAPQTLRADLTTLGYPDADDKSVLTQGESRLAALTWLAHQADPTFTPSTLDNLAAFWDRLGVHSAPRNKAGHRIPFTAPADRARDRNAANCFLRAAIDIVFAFRARRAEEPMSDSWAQDPEEIYEHDGSLSKFDFEAMQQLDVLIARRHLLFPSTTNLFQPKTAKKRPLQRRQVNTNKNVRSVHRANKVEKVQKDTIPSREHVLDRLRQIQRQAQDLEEELKDSRGMGIVSESADVSDASDNIADLGTATIKQLANDAKALCVLVEHFDRIAAEGLAGRERRTDLAKRDHEVEAILSGLSKDCVALEKEVQLTLGGTRTVKVAVEELVHGKPLLEGLPDSAVVREVLRQQQRTKLHM